MASIRAYHLPSGCRATTREINAGGVDLTIASPSAAEWSDVASACRKARAHLLTRPTDEVLATLSRVAQRWLAPGSAQRRLAEMHLPAVTGFAPEMIAHALPKVVAPLADDSLPTLLATELPRPPRRAMRPPPVILHILSGNIPGLGAIAMHLSLGVRSAAILKTAAGDPLSAALWAQAIAEVDSALGDCLAVTHWRGGDSSAEVPALAAADLVVASGSDSAIAALAARAPGRFLGHGHRISFALIDRGCLSDDGAAKALAEALAYDVVLWDQQGCLSPQLCYVEEGGRVGAREFARMLAAALESYSATLPARRLDMNEKAAVLRFRQEAEWGAASEVFAGRGNSAWSVSLELDSRFEPTCLNRCIRVKAVSDLERIEATLGGHRRRLEAAGAAIEPSRRPWLTRMLGDAGVHRVCPLGSMQAPPLSWCQGGRPRVADWVEWTQSDT